MNNTKKLAVAVAVLGFAALSGCASTQVLERLGGTGAVVAAEPQQVSRPAPTYGSMGGYRYRRFVAVTISAS